MEYLIDKYLKKPEFVKELFNKEVIVSLKVDGSAFQISYDKEKDNVTYHKRGGSSKSLGPIIDEYTQLMRKNVNDAIDFFEEKKNILKQYKFYAIEMFNNSYILLTVIDNDDNIIEDDSKLKDIANSLGIDCVPILFNGIIKNPEDLINMMTLAEDTTNETFKKYLFNLFGGGEYQKFLNGDEVEGIVLTWNIDNIPTQFKIINPAFKTRHGEEIKKDKEEQDKELEEFRNLFELLYDTLNKIGKHEDDNWIKNLDTNFLNLLNNESFNSEFKEICQTLKPKFKDFFTLQINKVSNEIKEVVKDDNIKFLYEKYLKLFFKSKKRNYIISKEFQMNVNKLIERLQNTNESKLSRFTRINMRSFNEYMIDETLKIDKDTKCDIDVYSSNTNKELSVKLWAHDKESWQKLESFVHQLSHFNLMKYSRIYVCELKDKKWMADTKKSYNINEWQPNYRYLYSSKNNYYTYKQVIELLNDGQHIIILANK